MSIKHLVVALCTFAALLYMIPASAGSMRCGAHIIQDGGKNGPGKYEVLKKCGEPVDRFGNTWIYELNGGHYTLAFNDNGILLTIRR
jgi:hypothetical protein